MKSERFLAGFGWGVVATIGMSLLMIIGLATGVSPMPKPIPAAIVGQLLGEGTHRTLIIVLAAIAHFVYGGFWGAALADTTRPVTIWKGIGLSLFLWVLMGLFLLPALGWGFFGTAIRPKIALATLILHLVYGITLGWLLDRNLSFPAPSFQDTGASRTSRRITS
jgi:hypothetical protein